MCQVADIPVSVFTKGRFADIDVRDIDAGLKLFNSPIAIRNMKMYDMLKVSVSYSILPDLLPACIRSFSMKDIIC